MAMERHTGYVVGSVSVKMEDCFSQFMISLKRLVELIAMYEKYIFIDTIITGIMGGRQVHS